MFTPAHKQNAKDLLMLALIFVAGLHFAGTSSQAPSKTAHTCTFPGCPMNGLQTFRSECEDGSDCYLTDLTHWQHPDWDSDQIEDYVFGEQGEYKPAPIQPKDL